MQTLPAESVDAVITSPPYAMQRRSTYGGVPESEYPAWTVAWMAEVRRLLKPDGSAIINIRPHIKNGQISDYVLRTRLALREVGWNEVDELIWFKRSSPPTGSPRKPRRSWESLHWFAKHGQPWSDAKALGIKTVPPTNKKGWFLSENAKNNGWEHSFAGSNKQPTIARCMDVAEINLGRPTESDRSNGVAHPAPYPPALAAWVGKLVCPPGGTVLDPFSGSASTGVAAIRNGWDYIGIDAVEEYVEMSRRRLSAVEAA
ncbi:DNA modification methylase [Agromyces sp. 3263]|uniref:DNA-methyltransferase n=1 Tax=Agromyces sp. 3263 TaxID=2817750 RepID=UPI002858A650|nr:site-specific DNA-methyltransferase [Agromyces sp. 3263]MDR6907487.1 DNA modification methylase [Agromyces sp. 3263]